jgi:cell division protein FtsB
VYGYFTLRGPNGVAALMADRQQVRKLDEDVANLIRENEYKRERIRKLRENNSLLGIEVRRRLKLLRPGETVFVLPGAPQ